MAETLMDLTKLFSNGVEHMPSHYRKHAAVIRSLFFVCLFCSGAGLEAQTGAPTPAAPSKSKEASDDSDLKLQNYQVKNAHAAYVQSLWQQLHGRAKNSVTVDERTNSIVFLANEAAAREILESLAFLDGETPSTSVQGPPTEVRVPRKFESPFRQHSLRRTTFKHAKAAEVVRILHELAGPAKGNDDMENFVVDERTNSLIWKVNGEWEARNFEEMCAVLESPGSASKLKKTPSPLPSAPSPESSSSQPTQLFTFSIGFERGEPLETLKQRYYELETQAHQLADKLKQSTSLSESQRAELQLAVRKSFETRQALQRAELADLAQRMNNMQLSIDMRDKLADKVVQQRVDDLLNPNLRWDAGKISEQLLADPKKGSSSPAKMLPPSPVPPDTTVHPYIPPERPATVIRKRIQGRWIVQTYADGNNDALAKMVGQLEVEIAGNSMRYLVGKQEISGPFFLADCKELESSIVSEDSPLPIDFVYDPNGDPQTIRGIMACDGATLSICMASGKANANKDFRPSLFVPGAKVTLLKCRRAELDTANAVSVGKATWKSSVQTATSKLLAAFPVPPGSYPNEAPKVIALIDVDYQGKQEAGDLKEAIFEWIADDVPFASQRGRFALLSRQAVILAMRETGLKPRDMSRSSPYYIENRQTLLKHLRSHELKVDAIIVPCLRPLGNFEDAHQDQFEIAMEGFIDARTNWLERITISGKATGLSNEPLRTSPPQFDTPQALLVRVDECSKNGSYEEFVSLFSDEGVRDLAGSLIVSAMQVTTMTEFAKQNGGDLGQGPARVQETLNRWL
jgi:hypothetical protein